MLAAALALVLVGGGLVAVMSWGDFDGDDRALRSVTQPTGEESTAAPMLMPTTTETPTSAGASTAAPTSTSNAWAPRQPTAQAPADTTDPLPSPQRDPSPGFADGTPQPSAPKPTSPPAPADEQAGAVEEPETPPTLTVYVAGSGGQAEIDQCIGAIDYLGYGWILAEHNYCGGDRYHDAHIGDYVELTGAWSGRYQVTSIHDGRAGEPHRLGGLYLQTSLEGGAVRLWQLTPA